MKEISIIIPCYCEENRFPQYLRKLIEEEVHLIANLIIVDDGSPQEKYSLLEELIKEHLIYDNVKLFHYVKNRGKGGAIEFGLEQCDQEITKTVAFLDSDGSIPSHEVKRMLMYFISNHSIDILIASRIKMLGRKVDRKWRRHLTGRIFISILNLYFPMNAYDTQCGYKIFDYKKYLSIKQHISNKNWLWDTQLVILFYYKKFIINEFPIDWSDTPGSKISIVKDSIKMFLGIASFKREMRGLNWT